MYKEDLDVYDKEVSLENLSNEVDIEYNNMSDDEKHKRLLYNDPTFIQMGCSFMQINKLEKCIINEYTYKIEKC